MNSYLEEAFAAEAAGASIETRLRVRHNTPFRWPQDLWDLSARKSRLS